MPGPALVSPDGSLNPTVLPLPDSNVVTTVVSALGARGVGQTSLVNELVGSSLATNSQPGKQTTLGANIAVHPGDPSAVQAGPPRRLVVLDIEGFDGTDRKRDESRDRVGNLGVGLADVLMFSVRMNDLPRMESNGVAGLRVGLTEYYKLVEAGIVGESEEKKLFIVVVRDYDADVLPRDELVNGFLREIQTFYESVSKPASAPARMSDVFEFQFVTLPSPVLAPEAFEDSVAVFRDRFTDPFCDDYFFMDNKYVHDADASLPEQCAAAWDALEEEETRDLPASKELMASFACGTVLRKVYDKYERGAPRDWDRETGDGNVIEDFGKEAGALRDETLAVFDNDAGPHRTSKAFQRKRDELKDMIDSNMYDLFTRQARKLREVSYGRFKEILEEFSSDDSNFEKKINKALKETQKYFHAEAEKLRPKNSSWRYDNESKELASHMREDATERLQQARLEEYSSGARGRGGRRGRRGGRGGASASKRQPISISFHYLDPAPFGWKDSRYEKLNADDPLEFSGNRGSDGRSSGAASTEKSVVPSLPILPGKNEAWDRDYIYQEKPGSAR